MSYSLEFEAEPFGATREAKRRPHSLGCGCSHCAARAKTDENLQLGREAEEEGGEGEWSLGSLAGSLGRAATGAAARVGELLGNIDGSRIIDLTGKADKTRRKGTRDQKSVYALVLHQMACCANRRDPLNSYLKVGAHFAILRDGRILQLHPVSALLWASNGFNDRSVAVEFAGNFPDTRGRWWKGGEYGKDQVTPAQIDSGRYLILWLKKSMGLTHVLAHRQSSSTRENDPGPDIWYHVGQWAIDNLKLLDGGPGFKIGTGNSIPDRWRHWNKPVPASAPAAAAVHRELTDEIAHEQWEEVSAEMDELDGAEFELLTQQEREMATGEAEGQATEQGWEEERRRTRYAQAPRFGAGRMFARSAQTVPAQPMRPHRMRPRFAHHPKYNQFQFSQQPSEVCPEPRTESARWVQSTLNKLQGLRLAVTGVIDAPTRGAIRSFQEGHGLPVDGIAGPEFERALIEARASGDAFGSVGLGAPGDGPPPSAKAGDVGEVAAAFAREPFELEDFEWEEETNRGSGEYITWVQHSLNQLANAGLVEDGISGPLTRAAVQAFQRGEGLTVDGIVGPITEAALVRAGAVSPPGSAVGGAPAPYLPVPAKPPRAKPATGSALRSRIVQIALEQRSRWNNGSLKEWDADARNILTDYWQSGVGMTPSDAAHFTEELYAWSAAFICWVLRKAGAGNDFAYSSYHSTYIAAAYRNQGQQSKNPFKAYPTQQSTPRLGDLLCTTYSSDGVRPQALLSQVKPNTGGYHCDIVVATAPGKLTVIGGNLSDSVGLHTVTIDPRGYVTDRTYFAVLRVG